MMISGIGIDILSLTRIRGVINRRGATLLAKRICTFEELESFQALRSNVDNEVQARGTSSEMGLELLEKQIRFLSSRWSLKEAAYKALSSHPTQKIFWKSLHVHHTSTGQPLVCLLPSPSTSTSINSPEGSHTPTPTLMASLSHDAGVVVAVVIALQPFKQVQRHSIPDDNHMQLPDR